jgi:hypothetical protein
MANGIGDDPSHTAIIEWVVGVMLVVGGLMLEVVRRMVKGKKSIAECDLLHKSITVSLDDIKKKLEKGDTKMDGMKETLIDIAATLRERSKNETERYDRHSKEWKDQ